MLNGEHINCTECNLHALRQLIFLLTQPKSGKGYNSCCILLYSLQAVRICAALYISAEFDNVCGVNYTLLLLDVGNRVSVISTVTGPWAERSGVRFSKEGKLFSKAWRPTVVSTRPYLINTGSSFPGRGADLVHVVPRLRMYSTTLPRSLPLRHEQRHFKFHLFVIRCYKWAFMQLSQHCENSAFHCVYPNC